MIDERSPMNWRFACDVCDFRAEPDRPLWHCPACGSALEIEGLDSLDPGFREKRTGLWRYAPALPVDPPEIGTILGEGDTPLVPVEIDGRPVHLKLDSHLPSGSFKDRGAAVLSRYLQRIGLNRIIVDSSGNAAAAMSAYAAALRLDCTVYVPASASPGKLAQARAHGADVIPVEGSREDVAKAAQTAAERDETASYASHNWHPVFVEGVKTWALEVFDQLGGRAPDLAFVPTGGGSAYVGAWRGFQAAGGSMPKLIACQPEACAPIVQAWSQESEITPVEQGETIAEGTRITMPSRPGQIQRALDASNGWAVAVEEGFLKETLRLIWGLGFYVEPTAALGIAAFRTAVANGEVSPEDRVVIHITGHGLKATPAVEGIIG